MNFFKRFFGTGTAYESAKKTDAGHSEPIIIADGRQELSGLDRLKIISKTRSLVRNFGFAREQVNAMEIYSVGDGISPQPATKDAEWNAAALDLWLSVFAWNPELSGRFTFAKLTRLVCRALDTDGEIFFIKTEVGGIPKLQVFEAHRVSNETNPEDLLFDGIRFDKHGHPKSYRFVLDSGETEEVAAENVIHVFIAERVSDAHGVPQLQHSINSLADSKYLLAIEKKGVTMNNELVFSITSDKNELGATSGDFVFGETAGGGTDPEAMKRAYGGGKIAKLAPGEKLERVNTDRPSATFSGFLDYIFRDASLGNVPYEFVSDSSKIGGAGVRLVVGRAARVFARRQQEIIETFLLPVWKFFIGWAISNGKLKPVDGFNRVEWACPRSVTVDAGREAASDRADVHAGLISKRDLFALRGMNYETEIRQIAKERELEKSLGLTTD